jgi:hypothetical protein
MDQEITIDTEHISFDSQEEWENEIHYIVEQGYEPVVEEYQPTDEGEGYELYITMEEVK